MNRQTSAAVLITMLAAVAGPEASARKSAPPTVALGMAEYLADPASGQAGRTVYFFKGLGNGHEFADFVYADPRRMAINGGNPGVTYGVKTGFPSADPNLTNQFWWMREAIETWNRESCVRTPLIENQVDPNRPGISVGGFDMTQLEADITVVGFDGAGTLFWPGSWDLAVTLTYYYASFGDEGFVPSDVDGNGKADVAFKEIYFNDAFDWSDNGMEGMQPNNVQLFDLPTVALHEAGHATGAAHFGYSRPIRDEVVISPLTVMNPIYAGNRRSLTGHDRAVNCSNWAQWPNK